MAQECSICTHPRRAEIDQAIARGDAHRAIAREFGVSRHALDRHKKNGHIAQQIAKAAEAKEIAEAKTLLDEVTSLKARALTILDNAENEGTREACLALREVRGIIELMAKVTGELRGDGPTINIIQAPQFLEFKAIVLGVMCDECRERLTGELRRIVSK